eukprot:TRINITY_DN61404_c0_g1_i1.p1 TRINITY_DN61404_c0_g1~~TRINITY_DN61404_c0_g1_i1.p1  ORF type:complete len:703 (-),score=99.98 TRINITY_DN61404_c0_g1_i1:234-2342(-)
MLPMQRAHRSRKSRGTRLSRLFRRSRYLRRAVVSRRAQTSWFSMAVDGMEGIFSSPCEGVEWDCGRHCWVARPLVAEDGDGSPVHDSVFFLPEALGMEGARLEAIKQRKAFEEEYMGREIRTSGNTSASGEIGQVAGGSSRTGSGSFTHAGSCMATTTAVSSPRCGAVCMKRGAISNTGQVSGVATRSQPVPVQANLSGGTVGGGGAGSGNAPLRTTLHTFRDKPQLAAVVPPRRHAGAAGSPSAGTRSPLRSRVVGTVGSPCVPAVAVSPRSTERSASPAHRVGASSGGAQTRKTVGSTDYSANARRAASPRQVDRQQRHVPNQRQRDGQKFGDKRKSTQSINSSIEHERRQAEQDRKDAEQLRNEVFEKVLELQGQVQQMQEENRRERDEKEALREDNERLKRQLDELSHDISVPPCLQRFSPAGLTASFVGVASRDSLDAHQLEDWASSSSIVQEASVAMNDGLLPGSSSEPPAQRVSVGVGSVKEVDSDAKCASSAPTGSHMLPIAQGAVAGGAYRSQSAETLPRHVSAIPAPPMRPLFGGKSTGALFHGATGTQINIDPNSTRRTNPQPSPQRGVRLHRSGASSASAPAGPAAPVAGGGNIGPLPAFSNSPPPLPSRLSGSSHGKVFAPHDGLGVRAGGTVPGAILQSGNGRFSVGESVGAAATRGVGLSPTVSHPTTIAAVGGRGDTMPFLGTVRR